MLLPILAGTLLFIVLSFFINLLVYLFRQKRKHFFREVTTLKQTYEQALRQAQIEVQETTYRHVAKELHDNVGQLLSTTKMLLGVTELKLGTIPDTMQTASATLSKAIQELRQVSRSLDREWLEQFNLLENLQTEIDWINAGETIKASLDCHTAIPLNPEGQIIVFRMVQEAIQNAVRHAQPSRIAVSINNGQQLEVKIVNDGKPLPAHFQGMGTNNMRQRARLFGGTVQWQSANHETIVTICLPLNHSHEH